MNDAAPAVEREPAKPSIRPIAYGTPDIAWEREPDGVFRMRSRTPLEPYAPSLARLFRAAVEAAPARVFLAERNATGDWRKLRYEEARATVDALAAALLARGLS